MGWLSKKVKTTFIDDDTGETIGYTKMASDDLPETFELQTTMYIGDAEWEVISANPITRALYSKSKHLTLRLRRIETMDPDRIMCSIPSICNAIPDLGDEPVSANDCLLPEDDWRQCELVSKMHAEEIEAELVAIRQIHEHHSAEVGWHDLHVRNKPERPIPGSFDVQSVRRAFGLDAAIQGVAYVGAKTRIAAGFSIKTCDGLTLYGLAPDDFVTVLGIVDEARETTPKAAIDSLASLAQEYELDLLYWCQCQQASPDSGVFRQLIARELGNNQL